MGWLSSIIKKMPIADVIRQVVPEESAPTEKQDVVLAYGPDNDTPAAEQLRNLTPVTPQQMAAPEGASPTGYQYYSGNLGEVGFGTVNPALYGEPKVMNYFNPVTGQYFQTATPLPESIVPEAWDAYVPQGTELKGGFFKGLKTTTEAPDRSEYIPNAIQGTGKGMATMAPAEEILAMQQGRPFGQSQQRQYGYQRNQQAPVRAPSSFQPQAAEMRGNLLDLVRKYADKSMMPALPMTSLAQMAKQPQQFADGGPVGMTQQEFDAYKARTGQFGGTTGNYSGAVPSPANSYVDAQDNLYSLTTMKDGNQFWSLGGQNYAIGPDGKPVLPAASPASGAMSTTPGATPGGLIPQASSFWDKTFNQPVAAPVTLPSVDLGVQTVKKPADYPMNTYMKDLGYGRYTGNPTDLGFKERQCGPMGCVAPAVMGNVYNPSTGQYFEVNAGNPFETMPEGWKYTMGAVEEKATGPYRNPQEAVITPLPGPVLGQRGQVTTAPVGEEGRRYGFDRSQIPAQRERFTPQGPGNTADLEGALREYRSRSAEPALPRANGGDVSRAELLDFLKKNRMGV